VKGLPVVERGGAFDGVDGMERNVPGDGHVADDDQPVEAFPVRSAVRPTAVETRVQSGAG
jgi:hypothetical protein